MSKHRTVPVSLTPELKRVTKGRPKGVSESTFVLELALEGAAARRNEMEEALGKEATQDEAHAMISEVRTVVDFSTGVNRKLSESIDELCKRLEKIGDNVNKNTAVVVGLVNLFEAGRDPRGEQVCTTQSPEDDRDWFLAKPRLGSS